MKKLMLVLGLLVSTVGYGHIHLDEAGLPRGSYNNYEESTCWNCFYDDNTGWLDCNCVYANSRSKVHSSINLKVLEQLYPELRDGPYDIVNDDGKLKVRLHDGREYQYTYKGHEGRIK